MQFTSPPALPQLPTRGQLPHKTNLQTPAGDPCVYKLHISSHSSRSPNDNMAASFAPSSVSFYPGMHAPSRPDPNNSSGSSKNYVLPIPSGFSVRVFKAPTLSTSSRPYANQPSFDKGDFDYRPTQTRQAAQMVRDGHRKLTKAPPRPQVEDYSNRCGRFGGVWSGPVPETYVYDLPLTPANVDYHHHHSSSDSDVDSLFSTSFPSNSSDSSLGHDPLRPPAHMTPHHHHHERQTYGHGWTTAAPYHSSYPVTNKDGVAPSTNGVDVPLMGSRPLPALPKDHTQMRHPPRPHLPPLYTADPHTGRGQWQPDLSHNHTGPQMSMESLSSESDVAIYPPPGLYPPGWEHVPINTPIRGVDNAHRPQRRNSEGHGTAIHPRRPMRSQTAPASRSVRWCEDLICPSPILPSQRRKGWFNRRGDQLWRNDGSYKPPLPGDAYPADLDDYPEADEGWQNEEGIRIDLNHRLIPKVPIRGVLKRTNYRPAEGVIEGFRPDASPTSDDDDA